MKKSQITLVGTNYLLNDALRIILEESCLYSVDIDKGSPTEAVRKIASQQASGLFVLCQPQPEISLIETLREASRRVRGVKILFVVKNVTGELLSFAGEKAGVGILNESGCVCDLKEAVSTVSRGERYISKSVLAAAGQYAAVKRAKGPLDEITPREREVLYWLSHGMTNVEIADRMILSEKTVKNHVSHMLRKLELTDRTKAAALAWREGLSQISEEFFSLCGPTVLK